MLQAGQFRAVAMFSRQRESQRDGLELKPDAVEELDRVALLVK
jgi:hypothetical protein